MTDDCVDEGMDLQPIIRFPVSIGSQPLTANR